MSRRSRPRDSGWLRWAHPGIQIRPYNSQQALCFFADEARVTGGHILPNPLEEAPDESSTHGLANLAEEMSVEPRDLSHGPGEIECQHQRWRFSKRVDVPACLFHYSDHPPIFNARLETHGRITRKPKARRPWVLAEVDHIAPAPLDLTDSEEVSKRIHHGRFHQGGPCFSNEPVGP